MTIIRRTRAVEAAFIGIAASFVLGGGTSLAKAARQHPASPNPSAESGEESGRRGETDSAARPTFIEVETGSAAELTDERGQTLGSIHDFVVERASGRVAFAIVRSIEDAARLHLVPYRQLDWDEHRRRLILPSVRYAECSTFRPAALRTWTPPAARMERDAAQEDQQSPWVLADDLGQLRVVSGATVVGWSAKLVLDVRRGSVAFVTVRRASANEHTTDPYVVPWQALTLTADGSLRLVCPSLELRAAPVLPKGACALLEAGKFRDELFRFYGVEARGRDVQCVTDQVRNQDS